MELAVLANQVVDGRLQPALQPRQRRLLVVQRQVLADLLVGHLQRRLDRLPPVLHPLHQPRQRRAGIVQRELPEDGGALVVQRRPQRLGQLRAQPGGLVGRQHLEDGAALPQVLRQRARQQRRVAPHVLLQQARQVAVLIQQAFHPLGQHPAGRIEVLAERRPQLAGQLRGPGEQQLADIRDELLPGLADGVRVHVPAGHPQGENADAQGGRREPVAFGGFGQAAQLRDDLGVGDRDGDQQGRRADVRPFADQAVHRHRCCAVLHGPSRRTGV